LLALISSSVLFPPPLLLLFHLQPNINPYPPRGSPLLAAVRVFRASVDIGQPVRQISPTQNHKTNGRPELAVFWQ